MDVIFNFTDECGAYEKEMSPKFVRSHPYYVRSNVFIKVDDYIKLENEVNQIKQKYGIPANVEVKWSHLGSRIMNRHNIIPHKLSREEMEGYFKDVIEVLDRLNYAKTYFTLTVNGLVPHINTVSLIKMHIQNAMQMLQREASNKNGYGILIADELNNKTIMLKEALYELSANGDQYTQYTNVQKGFLIDQSNLSCGLQAADIAAGVFTANLKFENAEDDEKYKYQYAHNIFENMLYKTIRYNDARLPYVDVYRSGVKEIPKDIGKDLVTQISEIIEKKIRNDLFSESNE